MHRECNARTPFIRLLPVEEEVRVPTTINTAVHQYTTTHKSTTCGAGEGAVYVRGWLR